MTTVAAPLRCSHCAGALAPEQDWCAECGGAATTRIASPPDWRVPAVLGLVAAAVAVAVVVLALIALL